MLRESPYKLGKYKESKRQRTDLLSNEKSSRPNLGKIGSQSPHNISDHPTQAMESKIKCGGLNKHVRSSATELKVFNEKDRGTVQSLNEASAQPAERIRRLSAVCEGWDKKMKRKRSIGTVGKRAVDNDFKRVEHSKLSSGSKLTCCEGQSLRANNGQEETSDNPSSLIKGKISKAPRSGFAGVCSSDKKVLPLGVIHELTCSNSSTNSMAQWVGQRPQKISRTRRAIVVAPILNLDEVQNPSPAVSTPDFGTRSCSTGNKKSFASGDVDNAIQEYKADLDNLSCSVPLVEVTRGLEQEVKVKKQDLGDVSPSENWKVQCFVFPTKRKEALANYDALENLGRTGRGLPLPRPRTPQMGEKLENVPNTMSLENMKPKSKKNRSKSEHAPSRKPSGRKASAYAGRMLSMGCALDADEVDGDHEELLAAATSARKAIYRACSSKLWKKMEPIFGHVSSPDECYLKQQLSFAEKLDGCLSQISGAEYDILGILTHEELASGEKQGSYSYPVVDNDDPAITGLSTGRMSFKVSSLFQIVLSALIEEDESEGTCNGNEGMGTSIQCASDGSHCGSCNYADVETRDGDRLESEAESKEDFQVHKRSGDRFSCTKSVSSNTRNPNISDSLYSSGRWQGEDILSHSDVEFVSGICQNDSGGSQPTDLNMCRTPPSDCQYQFMGLDDRLILELQSIGLYPDPMPNLAEEEEVIDGDIKELKKGLHQQVAKKKLNLAKIDEAVQDGKETEKQYIEQLAMNQLVEMAYKGRMVSRRNDGSRMMRKVSKQAALGFISRTVARCRKFELTGHSCFREPSLQDALFSAPEGKDEKSGVFAGLGSENNRCLEAPKHQAEASGSGLLGFGQTVRHSEYGFHECETAAPKRRKRSLLLNDGAGGASAQGATACGSVLGAVKGKRSERDKSHSRDVVRCKFASGSSQQSVGSCRSDRETSPKSKQMSNLTLFSAVAGKSLSPTSTQLKTLSNRERNLETGLVSAQDVTRDSSREMEPVDVANLPGAGAGSDPIEELGVPNDLGENQDFSSWFDDERLQDCDSMGLETPTDDISALSMLF